MLEAAPVPATDCLGSRGVSRRVQPQPRETMTNRQDGGPLVTGPSAPVSPIAATLWAKSKPRYALWRHLLDAAALAYELIPRITRPLGWPLEWLAAMVGLHDIGKADPCFQWKVPELCVGLAAGRPGLAAKPADSEIRGFRHEYRSKLIVRAALDARASDLQDPVQQELRRAVARSASMHHGIEADVGRLDPEKDHPERAGLWGSIREELCNLVFEACGATGAVPPAPPHLDAFGARLLAVTIASDWIASNRQLFRPPAISRPSGQAYFEAARASARKALNAVGIRAPRKRPLTVPEWKKVCPYGPPRGVQRVICELVDKGVAPGLAIIEAPMGEGKTEAAIHLGEHWVRALGLGGMYIALPTQATSNQMHRRYSEYLKRVDADSPPLLVHGMAWLLDDHARKARGVEIDAGAASEWSHTQRQEAEEWFRNARRALLAPQAVGTIDQVLFVALAVRFGALRLLGLSGKVLIVDEVHACDTFMQTRLERVLEWCRALGTPVILLSATLSGRQRNALIRAYLGSAPDDAGNNAAQYPLVTVVDPGTRTVRKIAAPIVEQRRLRVPLELLRLDLSEASGRTELAHRALNAVQDGGCAAVILNTVGSAQAFYQTLRQLAADDVEILLFHARFPAWRRQEIERLVEERFGKSGSTRPARGILVATQVAEQSLDIDFDVMFSEIAPIDRLLQRLGRMWRHERGDRAAGPCLYVVVPPQGFSYGSSESIYASIHLLRTHGVLETIDSIDVCDGASALIERVFGDPLAPCGPVPAERLRAAAEKAMREREREEQEASIHLIGSPDPEEFRYPDSLGPVAKEGEPHVSDDYLRATTRLGDYTRPIFALTRPEDASLVGALEKDLDDFESVRRLFATRVSVPRHWLREDRDGQAPALGELFGTPVVDLTANPKVAGMAYDAELGILGPETGE